MSKLLEAEIASTGIARVIVRLKDTTGNDRDSLNTILGSSFVSAENSVERQIASTMRKSKRLARQTEEARMHVFPNLGLMLGTVDKAGLKQLQKSKEVAKVRGAPVFSLIRPAAPPTAVNALTTETTWGIRDLGIPAVWAQGLTGSGVFVGHLDTGIDGRHRVFDGAIEEFREFDRLGFAVSPTPDPWDSGDHGTHTAGTIAGRPVQGRHIGVAPGCKLLSGMVIEGGDAVARVLAGMDWIVGSGARVLNMSLGFRGFVDDFLDVTQILRERGVLPVFASGNEGPGFTRSPGNYADALSVGAYEIINGRREVAEFSSSQRFARPEEPVVPDLVGPGVDVISAKPGGNGNLYQAMPGTSMATPHISGLAALLFEAKPTATVDEVESAIFASCRRPASMTGARVGRGVPDAGRALQLLLE